MKLSDFNTLADAKLHTQPFEREIPLTSVLRFLNTTGSDALLFASTAIRARMFLLALQSGVQLFDLRNSTDEGQELQQLLALLVTDGAVTDSFRTLCINYCNSTIKTFENATLHDFAVAKNDLTRFKPVSNNAIEQGYLKITTTADCEAHRPGVYKQVHGEYIRVTNFPVVSVAGDYIVLVTNHRDLFVDNVYNVVA